MVHGLVNIIDQLRQPPNEKLHQTCLAYEDPSHSGIFRKRLVRGWEVVLSLISAHKLRHAKRSPEEPSNMALGIQSLKYMCLFAFYILDTILGNFFLPVVASVRENGKSDFYAPTYGSTERL